MSGFTMTQGYFPTHHFDYLAKPIYPILVSFISLFQVQNILVLLRACIHACVRVYVRHLETAIRFVIIDCYILTFDKYHCKCYFTENFPRSENRVIFSLSSRMQLRRTQTPRLIEIIALWLAYRTFNYYFFTDYILNCERSRDSPCRRNEIV